MVHQRWLALLVEARGQVSLGSSNTDSVGNSLTQGPCMQPGIPSGLLLSRLVQLAADAAWLMPLRGWQCVKTSKRTAMGGPKVSILYLMPYENVTARGERDV